MSTRTLTLELAHGQIKTPVFMPCGTKGTVKGILPSELENIDVKILLGNTYHLFLRPGDELIAGFGGLHKFMGWNRPILTDSGGFQAFSLSDNIKISPDGIQFKSHLDGTPHLFTPEKVIDIQKNLGSDIMMPLDVCTSALADLKESRKSLDLTHKWWDRAWNYYQKTCDTSGQFLFPIVQGALHKELRQESAKFLSGYPVKGIAIGSIGNGGESKQQMYDQARWVVDAIGSDDPRPRYVMGIGDPVDLLEFIEIGIDMFDCVIPTRLGRHGVAFTTKGRINIRNAQFKADMSPLDESDWMPESVKIFSKSYLRHLISENEMLGARLLSLHNIHFLTHLMSEAGRHIDQGDFPAWKIEFLSKYSLTYHQRH